MFKNNCFFCVIIQNDASIYLSIDYIKFNILTNFQLFSIKKIVMSQ